MHDLRLAFDSFLRGDTLASPVLAGLSTSVVTLAPTERAKWSRGDMVRWIQPGTGNHQEVVRVVDVDEGTDRVTVFPALETIPTSAAVMHGGVVQWTVSGAAIRYDRPRYSAPAGALIDAADERRCVLLFGAVHRHEVFGSTASDRWEFHAISRSTQSAESLAGRIARRLNRNAGALSVPAVTVQRIVIPVVEMHEREDQFVEWVTVAEVIYAEVAA